VQILNRIAAHVLEGAAQVLYSITGFWALVYTFQLFHYWKSTKNLVVCKLNNLSELSSARESSRQQ
jgi:hypothetical protein